IYLKLGQVEIDDQAAGVKSLWNRRYVDKRRVGVFGVSYGGTASATCLLRYPEVFRAAASSSPVTDFRNYDTIYTERYLGLPQENKAAYDQASVLTYADRLKGRLLLYYSTADNNAHVRRFVHPEQFQTGGGLRGRPNNLSFTAKGLCLKTFQEAGLLSKPIWHRRCF